MKKRKLEVQQALDSAARKVPCIRLQGQWLEDLGYNAGDEVIVGELRGWLIIRPAEKSEIEDFN